METLGWMRFFGTWGLVFLLYVVIQVFALVRLNGEWRTVSFLPVLPMALVVYVTFKGYLEESNLWPLPLILFSPVALFFVVAVLLLKRRRDKSKAKIEA